MRPPAPPALPPTGVAGAPPIRRLPTAQQPDSAPPSRAALRRAAQLRRRAEAAERRRYGTGRRVRRARLAIVASVAAVVLLAAAAPAVALSPAFAVRTITVPGASAGVVAAVRAALAGQMGRPIALVSDADVATAVRRVPAVAGFTVVRLPPSTLEVRVTQRVPVLQESRAGSWALEDAAGVVLGVTSARWPDVPTVTVPAGATDRAAAIAAAAAAITALRAQPSVRIGRVTARSADDVVLTIGGGRTVQWGGADRSAAKAQALAATLRHAAAGVTQIDVSSPGLVLTR